MDQKLFAYMIARAEVLLVDIIIVWEGTKIVFKPFQSALYAPKYDPVVCIVVVIATHIHYIRQTCYTPPADTPPFLLNKCGDHRRTTRFTLCARHSAYICIVCLLCAVCLNSAPCHACTVHIYEIGLVRCILC